MLKSRLGAVALVATAMAFAAPAILPQSTPAQANALQAVLPSFAPLVKQTQPAVVTIRVEGRAPGGQAQIDPQMREFMERFFDQLLLKRTL